MAYILRCESNSRLSRAVVHSGVVYLAGITSSVRDGDIATQTKNVLETISARLGSVGSGKDKILSAQIWLKDIDSDFAAMNAAWDEWIPANCTPARATCEAKLASPQLLIEVIVTAAL